MLDGVGPIQRIGHFPESAALIASARSGTRRADRLRPFRNPPRWSPPPVPESAAL